MHLDIIRYQTRPDRAAANDSTLSDSIAGPV